MWNFSDLNDSCRNCPCTSPIPKAQIAQSPHNHPRKKPSRCRVLSSPLAVAARRDGHLRPSPDQRPPDPGALQPQSPPVGGAPKGGLAAAGRVLSAWLSIDCSSRQPTGISSIFCASFIKFRPTSLKLSAA